jgi:hypothetical protein
MATKLLARAGYEAKIGFRSIHICSGMPAATRWPIRGSIRERSKPTWATAQSIQRRATPRLRREGSKTSGGRRRAVILRARHGPRWLARITHDRRRRQVQGQAKAKTKDRYKGRVEDIVRNAGIASMLKTGQSWSAIQAAILRGTAWQGPSAVPLVPRLAAEGTERVSLREGYLEAKALPPKPVDVCSKNE